MTATFRRRFTTLWAKQRHTYEKLIRSAAYILLSPYLNDISKVCRADQFCYRHPVLIWTSERGSCNAEDQDDRLTDERTGLPGPNF